jgi:hypothetical protein
MSGESTPLLSGAVPAFETFMAQWEHLCDVAPRCSPYIEVGLRWARSYYTRMGKTRAYAISMRKSLFSIYALNLLTVRLVVDPTIRLTWIDEHWSSSEADNVRRMAKAMVCC